METLEEKIRYCFDGKDVPDRSYMKAISLSRLMEACKNDVERQLVLVTQILLLERRVNFLETKTFDQNRTNDFLFHAAGFETGDDDAERTED